MNIRWVITTLLCIVGCGEEHEHGDHDHGTHDAGASVDCTSTNEVSAFEIGAIFSSDDGRYSARVDAAMPETLGVGDNTWTMILRDGAGEPVLGATFDLEPTMPEHGHGTTPALFLGVESNDVAGAYEFGPFELSMAGLWRLSFSVREGEGSSATMSAEYCLDHAQ